MIKNKLIYIGILLIFYAVSNAVADDNSWSTNGPCDASVVTIAINPQDNQNILIGTIQNGIYESTDGGGSWISRADPSIPNIVRCVAFNPFAPDTVYASTIDGFYRSFDHGRTWQVVVFPVGWDFEIRTFAVHPTLLNYIFVGDVGLHHYKSTDGGDTWIEMQLPVVTGEVYKVDPNIPNKIYLLTQSSLLRKSIFRSDDLGDHWDNIHNDLDTSLVGLGFDVDPFNGDNLYLSGVHYPYLPGPCLSKSTDGGNHWSDITPPNLKTSRISSVTASPITPNTVFICTAADGVLKSTDGGENWFPANANLPSRLTKRIVIDTVSGMHYLGTYLSGIYRSLDEGETWEKISDNINNSTCTDLVMADPQNGVLFTTAYSGLYRSDNNGESWSYVDLFYPNYDVFAYCVDLNYNLPQMILVGAIPSTSNITTGGVYLSTDFGATWGPVNNGLPDFFGVSDITIYSPSADSARIFAATDQGLYISNNLGQNWTLAQDLPVQFYWTLESSPAADEYIYLAGDSLYFSSDGGVSWEYRNGPPGTEHINDMCADPIDPDILYACRYREGIYKSYDNGQNWDDISNNMPRVDGWFIVSGVAINPYDNNKIYANSYQWGIFYSTNGGGYWTAINDSLNTNYSTATTVINPLDTCMLYLATSIQSVWTYTQTETSISQPEDILPSEYSLSQNYPNPFNGSTTIEFALPEAGEVSIVIYDILGRQVLSPLKSIKHAGYHKIKIDMTDYPSGLYFYVLSTDMIRISKKMLYLK